MLFYGNQTLLSKVCSITMVGTTNFVVAFVSQDKISLKFIQWAALFQRLELEILNGDFLVSVLLVYSIGRRDNSLN